MTRPTTEELARRALESVARAHGVSVADVHAAVRGAAEHTQALGALAPGGRVNLERAMPANGRFGGHIVSGHIDGTGKVASVRPDDNALWYTISAAPELLRYIVEKGSITIDGISLTVAVVDEKSFSVSLIPHTAAVTTLGKKRAGDTVNLETDIIGKYVEKLLRPAPEPERQGGISLEFLAENGF